MSMQACSYSSSERIKTVLYTLIYLCFMLDKPPCPNVKRYSTIKTKTMVALAVTWE